MWTDGQRGSHDQANSRFFEFCERDYKRSIVHVFQFMQFPSTVTWSCVGFLAKESVGALRQVKLCPSH
jgi:hypothetical protein